ncbi:MAG: circularly permuted type 2 ATP-grasp protein [Gammaproteobacteria bacterium]
MSNAKPTSSDTGISAEGSASAIGQYAADPSRYDEMCSAPGTPRPHWQALHASLRSTSPRELNARIGAAERHLRDSGVTYNVYDDPTGLDRQWEMDMLPLLIAPAEWRVIEAGVAQRARLFNAILADFYGPQALLKEGLVPASLVLGHSGFIRSVHGMKPPGNIHLHLYAADLARAPDGQWWVIADRTQAPSGAGYALENRLTVSQVFPELFRNLHVRHLAQYFATMRDALRHHAPKGDGPPLCVVLTPGPYNETYFEHALLARYLGFRLVEGGDLTVSDGKVWLKTIDGPRRVHAIIRRQDDSYCDPLELRADSTLGIAGLMDCVRRGSVLVANPPGAGVLEGGALLGYLPRLCEHLLGEALALPSIATWWCGEPLAMQNALQLHEQLVFKPADPAYGFEPVFGRHLTTQQVAALKQQIAQQPVRFVAQELVDVSQAPVLAGHGAHRFEARGIGLRVHASIAPGGSYVVMPGGLTRVAAEASSQIVSMQRGGSSKDTWVLAEGPLDSQLTLLRSTLTSADLVEANGAISSRVAENEFWFGRTSERCECIARLLRVALDAVLQETEDGIANPVFAMAAAWGLFDDGAVSDRQLLEAATREDAPRGLAANLRRLNQIAYQLRDRLSLDHWRAITSLVRDPGFDSDVTLPQCVNWIDRTIQGMTTLSGFALDSMSRDTGFRFLSIGRRLERLSFMTRALTVACNEGRDAGLTWLLELCDSVLTYRRRYMAQPEWLPVMDLLIRDPSNPRSVMFQAKGIHDYLVHIEKRHGACGRELLVPGMELIEALDLDSEFHPDSPRLRAAIDSLQASCHTLSNRLTLQFFNHPGMQKDGGRSW